MGKFAIFVDGGYFDKVLEEDFGRSRVDLGKLPDEAKRALRVGADATLLRAYFYHCPMFIDSPPSPEQQQRKIRQDRYFEAIRRLPRYEVRLGRLAHRGTNAKGEPILQQKGVDVLLAMDLLLLAVRKDISDAILITGDADFVPVVKAAKDQGIVVHLLHAAKGNRTQIWSECDNRVAIDASFVAAIRRP